METIFKQRRNRILISLPLMAALLGLSGCMKSPLRTLQYFDKKAPSEYMAGQRARELKPHALLANKGDKEWAQFLDQQKAGTQNPDPNSLPEDGKGAPFYLSEAEKAIVQGRDKAAISHLKTATGMDPENFAAWEKLGLVHLRSKEDDAAEVAFQRAINIKTDSPQSYNGLGIVHDNRGEYQTAEGFYQLALRLDPDNPRFLNNQGFSFLLARETDKAVQFFKEAVKRDPGFSQAHNNLGLAYAMAGNYKKAIESFKTATDEAGAYNNLGYLYHKEGKRTQAIASFQKAVETSPIWYTRAAENLDSLTLARGGNPNPVITP